MSRTDWAGDPRHDPPATSRAATPAPAAEDDSGAALVAAARRRRAAAPDPAVASEMPPPARRRRAKVHAADDSALAGVPAGAPPRWTPWGIAAALLAGLVLAGTIWGAITAPTPQKVARIRPAWVAGPQVSYNEFLRWIWTFPLRERLVDPNAWVLDRLVDHLRATPGIAEVRQVRLVHEPDGKRLARVAEVELSLRTPFLPGVLGDGRRVWLDREGRVLPGILPAPASARPVVRQIEAGGRAAVAETIALWSQLETALPPGLVSDILLGERLDETGARGIVLITRPGARLVWGRPGEERFGVDGASKCRDLVRTLRAQGDLSRIADINVRFREPFYTMRDAAPAPAAPAAAR